jgi:Ni/Fe-hydrogenase subunit HybB-like protein
LPDETRILGKLSGVMAWLILAYLVIRFADVIVRGQIGLAFKFDLQGNMFLLENMLLLIPMFVLLSPANRKNPQLLFLSALSIVFASALYRLNTYLIGFDPGGGWTYFPATGEIFITLGIVAIEIMAFLWFVKRLPVYHKA